MTPKMEASDDEGNLLPGEGTNPDGIYEIPTSTEGGQGGSECAGSYGASAECRFSGGNSNIFKGDGTTSNTTTDTSLMGGKTRAAERARVARVSEPKTGESPGAAGSAGTSKGEAPRLLAQESNIPGQRPPTSAEGGQGGSEGAGSEGAGGGDGELFGPDPSQMGTQRGGMPRGQPSPAQGPNTFEGTYGYSAGSRQHLNSWEERNAANQAEGQQQAIQLGRIITQANKNMGIAQRTAIFLRLTTPGYRGFPGFGIELPSIAEMTNGVGIMGAFQNMQNNPGAMNYLMGELGAGKLWRNMQRNIAGQNRLRAENQQYFGGNAGNE